MRALKSADLFLVPSHPSEATTPSRHLLIRMTRVATLAEKRQLCEEAALRRKRSIGLEAVSLHGRTEKDPVLSPLWL